MCDFAWKLGWEDAAAGKSYYDNPFPSDQPENRQKWLDAFLEAQG